MRATGFATRTIQETSFPLVVTLHRGCSLKLRFTQPIPHVPEVRGYRILLTRPGPETSPRGPGARQEFVRRGGQTQVVKPGSVEVVLKNLVPGPHELRLMVSRTGESGEGRNVFVSLGTIEVQPGVAVGEVPVPLTANQIREALR